MQSETSLEAWLNKINQDFENYIWLEITTLEFCTRFVYQNIWNLSGFFCYTKYLLGFIGGNLNLQIS